ncbi:MAG: molecular chaperone GroEL [Marinibacterium sp.]
MGGQAISRIHELFAAWGDPNAESRAAALRAGLADPFSYTDPRTPEPITSADGFADYVAMFSQAAPGATVRVANLSEAKGCCRATVEFRMADGKVQLGQYFIDTDAEGRATRLVGFVGIGAPE